jgi:hypothetical protein
MSSYSDTSRRTFDRAIELLRGRVDEPIVKELRALVDQEKVHDAEAVIAAFDKHLALLGRSHGN